MKKITINIDAFNTNKEFHEWLKEQCEFPEYYGCNLDALYDVLSERPVYEFEIVNSKKNEEYQNALVDTIRDAGCKVNYKKNIKLVKLSEEYKELFFDMMDEWSEDIKVNHTNHSPWAIFRNDYHDFDYYVENLELKEETNGRVPDTTLFCLDIDRNRLVGAVNIRHYLNESLLYNGGHIGDGIRPSERRKGYATAMIALALEECRKLGIDRVLMCCDKDNIGSMKSIISNGGVLENEVVNEDGGIEQRYWIEL